MSVSIFTPKAFVMRSAISPERSALLLSGLDSAGRETRSTAGAAVTDRRAGTAMPAFLSSVSWILPGPCSSLGTPDDDSHNLVLHRPEGSQAQQIVVRRDQRKIHDLSGGGQKPIRGITVRQRELLGEQHDFVGERRFPQRCCGCGQPFGQIVGEPNPALGVQQ